MWIVFLAVAAAAPTTEAVREALAPRHATCDAVAALGEEAVPPLIEVAETVTLPPWVAPRAAACLADLLDDPRAREAAARWVDDPARIGLALPILDRLPDLSPEVAADLAGRARRRAAADPRAAAYLRPRLERAER